MDGAGHLDKKILHPLADNQGPQMDGAGHRDKKYSLKAGEKIWHSIWIR